jgi:hypothetical protein
LSAGHPQLAACGDFNVALTDYDVPGEASNSNRHRSSSLPHTNWPACSPRRRAGRYWRTTFGRETAVVQAQYKAEVDKAQAEAAQAGPLAQASAPCREVLPTKMAKARPREIEREAMRMATANENTMPMFANVRSIPEEMPNASGGAAFMTAKLLAGKKKLAPMPLTTLATTTTHSPVVMVSWA